MPTKPIAVVKLGKGEGEIVLVVCEDGSAYTYSWEIEDWTELPPVPGTEAAGA